MANGLINMLPLELSIPSVGTVTLAQATDT
jgi:hypothetical protein